MCRWGVYMTKLIIDGPNKLSGTIEISGAKNSVVALIPAAILCDDYVTIDNVPNITDTKALLEILNVLKATYSYKNNFLEIDVSKVENQVIEEALAKKLRASYYFMGALLSKYHHVEMFFPGGCKIGKRPIDYHLKGFETLGAKVVIDGDKYIIDAEELNGADITFDFPSVGATINIILAAVKANGQTRIFNAAKEPEIVNVADFLKSMGAKIKGAGTDTITITGVKKLSKGNVYTIPDRIEAGTYIIAGALAGEDLVIDKIEPKHLTSLLETLKNMNINYILEENSIIISKQTNLLPVNITSSVYPGFVTDLGQTMQTLLTQANGISTFTETIYETRMGHIEYLNKMGANIANTSNKAFITGPTSLSGTYVKASDLRAGAALVLAGLIADGKTTIDEADHILRGYENINIKLSKVGAKIRIEE